MYALINNRYAETSHVNAVHINGSFSLKNIRCYFKAQCFNIFYTNYFLTFLMKKFNFKKKMTFDI